MEENDNKFINSLTLLKSKTLSFFKSEIVKIGGTAFLGAFLLVFTIPLFFDNSGLKFQITSKVAEVLGANLAIKGDVDIAFLPTPHVTIHEALIQNFKPDSENLDVATVYNFYASEIEIKLPLLTFSDEFAIKELIFKDVMLERYYDNNTAAVRENGLTSLISKVNSGQEAAQMGVGEGVSGNLFPVGQFKFSKTSYNFPKITIDSGTTILYDIFGRKKEISDINGELFLGKKKITAEGTFTSENITSNFEMLIKFNATPGKMNSFLKVASPVLNLRVDGNFPSENKTLEEGFLANDFQGQINMEIAELRSFYKSYLNNYSVIASRLKYNAKPISLSCEMVVKEGEMVVDKLEIKSTLLDGTGKINLSKKDKKIPVIDIDLTLENLDLDNIWSSEVSSNGEVKKTEEVTDKTDAEKQVEEKKESAQTINLDLTKKIKNFDLSAEIKIKNVKYLNGQIRDASLYLTASKEGEILVMPLIFQIPGEGVLRMNGAIDNHSIAPKFVGKIDVVGKSLGDVFKWLQIYSQNLKFDNLKNYTLYSDVLLLPDSISLNSLYLSLNNNGSEMLGELKVGNLGKSINTAGRFQISKFDVDDYFFTSSQNIYLAPGSLLKKLLWLNNITVSSDFDLNFDKLIYKDEVFNNQKTKLRFGHGYFEIYELSLNSDNTDLQASLAVDISSSIPKFNLKINADKLHYKTSQMNFVNRDGSVKETEDRNFFDQLYALPSIEDFSGKIALEFDDLEIDGVSMKNAKLSGMLKEGNITNAEALFDIYDGNLTYNGFLGVKLRKTINGNIVLRNASINPLLRDIFGIKNIYGIANVSANVTSVAANKSEFASNLTSEVKFSSNAPYIEGYGLSDLIKKMLYPTINAEELRDPEKILVNKDARTVFKQARGNFQISGGENGKVKIDVSAPAMNAILSGNLDPEKPSIDVLFNAIFITGNSRKQTPINIATSLKGPTDNISQSTNMDQAKQYLGLMKIDKPSNPNSLIPSQENIQPAPAIQNPPMQNGPAFENPQAIPNQQNTAPQTIEKTTLIPQQNAEQPQMFEVPLDKIQ
jgi:hypothetical protein